MYICFGHLSIENQKKMDWMLIIDRTFVEKWKGKINRKDNDDDLS